MDNEHWTYYWHQFRNYNFLHSINVLFLVLSPLLLTILLLLFAPKWVHGNIVTNIAKMVKDTVLHQSSTEVTKMMKSHLMQMQLINAQENWAHPSLKSIEHFLFPRNLTGQCRVIFSENIDWIDLEAGLWDWENILTRSPDNFFLPILHG